VDKLGAGAGDIRTGKLGVSFIRLHVGPKIVSDFLYIEVRSRLQGIQLCGGVRRRLAGCNGVSRYRLVSEGLFVPAPMLAPGMGRIDLVLKARREQPTPMSLHLQLCTTTVLHPSIPYPPCSIESEPLL
jgi:hypothetical protein